MHSKSMYQAFCQSEPELPIFMQPWYLNAVCQKGNWEVVCVQRGGQVVAALPYYLVRKGPFRYIGMPWLTKMMGPYVTRSFRKSPKLQRMVKELIEQLPKVAAFHQNFHYAITDWLPFYWKGYRQTTMYSYVLAPLNNLDDVYKGIHSDYRNNKIKKARSIVRVTSNRSLEDFYRVQTMSFTRQGKPFAIPFSFLKKYDAAMEPHQCRKLFFAVDEQERIHSVVYLLWDNQSAYYLMAGDDPALRSSGAGILLVWEAIQYAQKELGLDRFDFQGSMIPAIEKVRRKFGARQAPYFRVWKEDSVLLRLARGGWGRGM